VNVRSIQLFLGVTATLFIASCTRVQWPVTRELCGRIQIVDNQSRTMLRDADLTLYRSKSESPRCCSEADMVAGIRIDSSSNFNSGKLNAGRYFVVVKNSPQIVFPVYLETNYDGDTCSLNTVFSFDRITGKTEQTATIRVYRTN